MNNVDSLFATIFALAFAPVAAMYLYGIATEMANNPSSHNASMIMPPTALIVGAVIGAVCAGLFLSFGLVSAGWTVLAIIVGWVVLNILLVAVSTFELAH